LKCNSLQVKVLTKVTNYCNEVKLHRCNPALGNRSLWVDSASSDSSSKLAELHQQRVTQLFQ